MTSCSDYYNASLLSDLNKQGFSHLGRKLNETAKGPLGRLIDCEDALGLGVYFTEYGTNFADQMLKDIESQDVVQIIFRTSGATEEL